eukprot:703516-Rhodomonas_salina.1
MRSTSCQFAFVSGRSARACASTPPLPRCPSAPASRVQGPGSRVQGQGLGFGSRGWCLEAIMSWDLGGRYEGSRRRGVRVKGGARLLPPLTPKVPRPTFT